MKNANKYTYMRLALALGGLALIITSMVTNGEHNFCLPIGLFMVAGANFMTKKENDLKEEMSKKDSEEDV